MIRAALSSSPSTPNLQAPPTVSILINNYNYRCFLQECIESCLNQTQLPLEIIVVDDGSSDGSQAMIQEYGVASELVVPILKANGGQASAVNAGFLKSRGDVIVLLDADDYFHAKAVETIAAAWQPNQVMLQCRLDLVNRNGGYIDLYPAPELTFDSGDVVPLLLKTGQYCTTVTSGLSFSRAVLEKILPIPEEEFRLCADGYLVTVAPFYGSVASVETPVGGRRKHENNLWASAERSVAQRRKAIEHDFARYRHLALTAEALGFTVPSELGLQDPLHLTNRLTSLRLEPEHHPAPKDQPLSLALRGIKAIWAYSNLSHRRRIVLMLWFLGAGFLPRILARSVIQWRFSTQSRPVVVNRMLKLLRTATQ